MKKLATLLVLLSLGLFTIGCGSSTETDSTTTTLPADPAAPAEPSPENEGGQS